MTREIFVGYLTIGFTIAAIYVVFRSVGLLVDIIGDIILLLSRPKPNRKRTSGNLTSGNLTKYLEIAIAASEFGFNNNNLITENELKRRFRKKIKKVHPDHGGNDNDFIRVKKAYDLLLSL